MKVNLENLPALLVECGEMVAHEHADLHDIVKKLSARCALFAGIVGKMAAHIAELEKKIDALAPKPPAEKAADSAKPEAEESTNTEDEEEKAPDDLDSEILEMARALNGGQPAEVQEAAMQKGETL